MIYKNAGLWRVDERAAEARKLGNRQTFAFIDANKAEKNLYPPMGRSKSALRSSARRSPLFLREMAEYAVLNKYPRHIGSALMLGPPNV